MCGDPWHGPLVNQPGPNNIYATGTIVASYSEGEEITAKVQITAHHLGMLYNILILWIQEKDGFPSPLICIAMA